MQSGHRSRKPRLAWRCPPAPAGPNLEPTTQAQRALHRGYHSDVSTFRFPFCRKVDTLRGVPLACPGMSLPFGSARTGTSARRIVRRCLVLGLALVLLSPLLGPAPSEANSDSNQLDQTRRELAAIQKKLAQSKGEAAKI